MTTTGATLFGGSGGADLGMAAAGIEVLWGLDNAPAIVAVARANGLPMQVADVCAVDPRSLESVDWLHTSPPCPRFSNANANKGEAAEDVDLALGVCKFIRAMRPRFFSLENVSMYRKSDSFALIMRALTTEGYFPPFELVNFADLGVPQTRRRLILRAVRDGLVPPLSAPRPWQGWYPAVADLLPDLPTTQFAPWQLARGVLEQVGATSVMVARGSYDYTDAGNERPAQPLGLRRGDEPAFTMMASMGEKGTQPRAFIVDDQYGARDENGRRVPTIRSAHEPVFTISATQTKNSLRAAVGGRVVALTPRCGARLQTFPDGYSLPVGNELAWRGLGNAVPPLAMQRLCEGLLR